MTPLRLLCELLAFSLLLLVLLSTCILIGP
jgi:hypothetical protein